MCEVRQFNDTDDFSGPLFHINYFALMDCNWYPRVIFAFLVVILLLFLKTTADEFLTGALTVICEITELSQDVAGATFLAFGNGAPDVFSTLAAFSKGNGSSNVDLGLGSLLGGMLFVTTVVLGSVILATKEEISVQFESFGRDIIFLIVAVVMVVSLHFTLDGASIGVGIFFLLLYVLYVVLVVYQSRMFRYKKCWNDDPEADKPLISGFMMTDIDEIAFSGRSVGESSPSLSNYQPLADSQEGEGPTNQPMELVFNENYIAAPATTVTQSLHMDERGASEVNKGIWSCRNAVFQDLYWRQLRIRQRAIRQGAKTASELAEMNWFFRVLSVVQMPLGFVRALTVPLPETETWSRGVAALHPPFSCAFFLYVFAQHLSSFPLLLAIFIPISMLLSCITYCSMHESRPPTSKAVRLAFAFVSFIMCVTWIYAVASEIVALFNSFGTLYGANSSILGLSFLAWGDSIGDLVTNIAIAKSGMPAMGVAACVASPVFNSLFGLGASITLVAIQDYPNGVPISLDRFTTSAVILLFIVLGGSLAYVKCRQYRLSRGLGIMLIASYIGYLILMGILSLAHVA